MYTVGVNDAGGEFTCEEDIDKSKCCTSPVMPYIGRKIEQNAFARLVKYYFIADMLRCNFAVFDVKREQANADTQTRLHRANRHDLSLLVNFGCNMFGSGNVFNSRRGCAVYYSEENRFAQFSRALAEDIYERLLSESGIGSGVSNKRDFMLKGTNCPAVYVNALHLTNFSDAKLSLDPDFARCVAHKTARGICDYLNEPYIGNDDCANPDLRQGNVGNDVARAQAYLNVYGYLNGVDGIFGADTKNAVTAFQIDNSLIASGAIDEQTWHALLSTKSMKPLKIHEKGACVWYAKRKLAAKLYPISCLDCIFDEQMHACVTAFQEENNLPVTGELSLQDIDLLSVTGGGRSRLF